MATKKENGGNAQSAAPQEKTLKAKTKIVHNRGNGKIELLINGNVVIFPPKGSVEVPIDFDVPFGIGLYVK